MSVRKIRNSWWVDFRVEGVRHRKRSPENSQTGAKAYEALLRQRLTRGEALQAPTATSSPRSPVFAEAAQTWLTTWAPVNYKLSTARRVGASMRSHLLPWFGRHRLDQITSQEIERFKASRKAAGASAYAINADISALRACLRTAVQWSLLADVPRTKWLRTPPGRTDFLSPEELRILVDGADGPLWRDMIWVAAHTGLRFGELSALDWSDVALDARCLTVRRNLVCGQFGTPKNGRERHVPLTDKACEVLRRRGPGHGLVFALAGGHFVYHEAASRALRRACQQARLRPIGWHVLRHTFASQLRLRGADLGIIQKLLGHSKIEMTLRYAHLGPNGLAQAVGLLDTEPGIENLGQPVGNALPTMRLLPQAVPVG